MGFAFGMLGPKVGWGRWTTHGIGALFAGLVIPIMAGWAISPGTSPDVAFQIAAKGSAEAYLDIVWRGLQYTSQEVHYIVVLGSLLWATAQFFGYAVFGHHKPLNGLVMVGIVIVGNMALTSRIQLPFLGVFTVASLFLLIVMHAFDERSTLLPPRNGRPSGIAVLCLRGAAGLALGPQGLPAAAEECDPSACQRPRERLPRHVAEHQDPQGVRILDDGRQQAALLVPVQGVDVEGCGISQDAPRCRSRAAGI